MTVVAELITPFEEDTLDGVSAYFPNRFPTPPTSWGFCTDLDFGLSMQGLTGIPLVGALVPEGGFLEPTTGQIWPR
jgi:hypothetical protein